MTTHTLLIPRYESIAEASARMLDAARGGDWDGLVCTERECASLIHQLQAIERTPATALEPQGNRERIHILQLILRHDAEIRDLTQHWLRGLGQLLRASGLERTAHSAYRAPPPAAAA